MQPTGDFHDQVIESSFVAAQTILDNPTTLCPTNCMLDKYPKPEISELLADEIVSRYYYQKGAIKAALRDDADVKKALEVLHTPEGYAAIFEKGKVIKAN